MTIETANEKLSINKLVCEKKEMIFVEGDMIVPDSKPDILNTIDTSGTVCIYKKEIMDNKIKIDGNINTYIMYVADEAEDNIRGLNTNLDFSQVINVDNCDENMILETEISKKSIECKVLNERKISIKVGLEIKIKIYSNEETEIINAINGCEELQVLEKSMNVNSLIGSGSTKAYVKDTLVIDNADNLAEILKSDISLVDKDVKISYNKVLAKAEANIKIMYLTEENEIKNIENRMPIVGFVDIQNVSDENICDTDYEIKNIILKPNSVEEHSIYIELEVEIICKAYENKNINLIEDMYSPCKDVKFNQRAVKTVIDKINRKEVCKVENIIKVDELNNGRLIDVNVLPIINKQSKQNAKVLYEGEIQLKFIYLVNNSITSKIVNLPLEYIVDNIENAEKMNINEQIDVNSKDFIVQSGGNIDCNIELVFYIRICRDIQINIIEEVNIEESRSDEDYSLIMYIVKENDTLWSIAKRYKSTIDDIVRVNGIENPDKIYPGDRIYIPKYVKRGVSDQENSSMIKYA